MFQNVLVPVDLTEKNRPAIQQAIELTDPEKGTIRLLHVVETIQDVPFDQLRAFYNELQEKAEKTLEVWAKEFGAEGRDIRIAVIFGRRITEILAFAQDTGCDLIVMTSHKLDAETPGGGIGTISHQAALLANAPVLLLR